MPTSSYPFAGNDLIFLLSGIHDDPSKCLSVSRADRVSVVIDDYAFDPDDTWIQWLVELTPDALVLWHFTTHSKLVCAADGTLSMRPGMLPRQGEPANYALDEQWTLAPLDPLSVGVGDYQPGYAVRPLSDSARHLNVLGNPPYLPGGVVAAPHGNGGITESWSLVLVPGEK
jgi:hypothetical protein